MVPVLFYLLRLNKLYAYVITDGTEVCRASGSLHLVNWVQHWCWKTKININKHKRAVTANDQTELWELQVVLREGPTTLDPGELEKHPLLSWIPLVSLCLCGSVHPSRKVKTLQSGGSVVVLITFAWRSLSPLHNKCLKTTGSLTMLLCQHLSRFLLQDDAPCQEAQAWFHEQNRLFQSRATWPLYTISVVCQPGSASLVALTTSGSMLQ